MGFQLLSKEIPTELRFLRSKLFKSVSLILPTITHVLAYMGFTHYLINTKLPRIKVMYSVKSQYLIHNFQSRYHQP